MKTCLAILTLSSFLFQPFTASAAPSAISALVVDASAAEAFDLEPNCTTPGNCPTLPDHYAVLEGLYAEGTLPAFSDVTGWFTGRCYWTNARHVVKAGLLVGQMEQQGGNSGPLFPGSEVLRLFAVQHLSGGPEVFDHMTPAAEAEINVLLARDKHLTLPACVEDHSLMGPYGSSGKWYVRKARNYLVLKVMQSNDPMGYCYFFRKVK